MGKQKARPSTRSKSAKNASTSEPEDSLNVLNDTLLAASSLVPESKELEKNCKEIWELIQKIRVKQKENKQEQEGSASDRRQNNLGRFTEWCQEKSEDKFMCDKVELKLYEGLGVGVAATQKIQHHEMFLSIPEKMMMTVDHNSSIAEMIFTDPIASKMPNIALAIQLLYEKYHRDSTWKPYIAVLPESYDTTLYFSPDELKLLKGSSTYDSSLSMMRSIARQYAYFWQKFHTQTEHAGRDGWAKLMRKYFSYDDYRWAVSTVMTRQNIIPAGERSVSGGRLALIPFWDMCNHKQGEMLTDFDDDLHEIHCYSIAVCGPGDQVFICYSTRPNADFLVHNGFYYTDNPNDNVMIKLGFGKTDRLLNTRKKVLAQYDISGSDLTVFYLTKEENPIPSRLMTFLRIFNATEDELTGLISQSGGDEGNSGYISCENDEKCWKYLVQRCKLLGLNYKGNFSACENLVPHHVDLARQQTEGEKAILNSVITYCENKLKD